MHKTIEMVKGKDGVYREGKQQPQAATFRGPRSKVRKDPLAKAAEQVNEALEEIGLEALNALTRGFFRR